MNEQEQLKSEKIKQILACPKCGGEIEIKSDAGFCLACGQSFKIKDEVFLFAKKSMFDVEHRTLSEGSKIDGLMEKSKLFFKKWPNLFSVFYYAFGASFVGLSSKKAIKNLGKDKIIINLGSGIKTIRDDVINIDFVDFKNVSITADVSQLPIKNNAVDGVVCEVLLEHTKNPAEIVKEMRRVLKPGGLVYLTVPFVAGFHSSPHDYFRWSKEGIKELMKDFEQKQIGIRHGPTSALVSVLSEWLATLFSFGIKQLQQFWLMVLMIIMSPIKLVDFLIYRFPTSQNIAYGFYYLGTKKDQGSLFSDSQTGLKSKGKLLLISPPFDLMKQGYGSKRKVKAGFFPPLGLGYLATPLLKKGYEIKIIDCSPIGLNNEDVLRIAKEFKPDLFGISAVTAMAESSYELIEFLKKHFPEIPVGFGGPHVNCFKQEVFGKAPSLDFIGFGECEKSFEQFVEQYIETKKLPEDIPGMIVKSKDGGLKINPAAPITHNLDDIEMPAHQLYDYSYYRPMPLQYKKRPAANMITSRGCPWKRCTYCFEAGKAGQVYRRHSPERAVEEIKFLIKTHGVKEISFWDDNFLINQEWIFKFCDLLDKEGIKIPWSAVARVNTITKTMLIRAKKSGLWNIFFGVESGNQDLLDRIKKGITLDQVRQAVKWCNELGIDTRGSLMLALPGETPEKARKTIDYACSLGLTFAQFLPTHPEWGTELYYDALSSGRIVPLYKGRTTPTYIPDGYDNAEQITKMQKLAYRKFYFRPSYIWLHFKRLKDFGKIKQYIDAFRYILGVSS